MWQAIIIFLLASIFGPNDALDFPFVHHGAIKGGAKLALPLKCKIKVANQQGVVINSRFFLSLKSFLMFALMDLVLEIKLKLILCNYRAMRTCPKE